MANHLGLPLSRANGNSWELLSFVILRVLRGFVTFGRYSWLPAYSVIGQPIVRGEGPEKVSGQSVYASDVNLPGMLWGKILRSPLPYARIVSIDTSQAKALPGVHAVITGQDIPDRRVGRLLRDCPVLCKDKVLFVGDKVAAVAADDPDIAEEALLLIDVEYEDLSSRFRSWKRP